MQSGRQCDGAAGRKIFMSALYPLRFEPIFRRYIWGGRKLGTLLNKSIGEGNDFAESWEMVDRGADQSRVVAGPLAGKTLGELVANHGQELLGRHHPQPRFPLLFKFLDCEKTLSVQVHPNDQQAAKLNPPDLGKTEAWVVLSAEPGSLIYAGLKRGFDRPGAGKAKCNVAPANYVCTGSNRSRAIAFFCRPGRFTRWGPVW